MDGSEIIRRIAEGDKEAFQELVKKYKDQIFKICYKFVKFIRDIIMCDKRTGISV